MLEVRKTELTDLDEVMEIYANGRKIMRESGNPNQWGTLRPYREQIANDINMRNSYVVLSNNEICGVFSLVPGIDPTYVYIEGDWLNDEPYITIHRIATAGKVKGILKTAVEIGFTLCDNIKVDTHHNNVIMQHLLDKYDFTYCGIIYLENGEPRKAYQKTKE